MSPLFKAREKIKGITAVVIITIIIGYVTKAEQTWTVSQWKTEHLIKSSSDENI